MSPFTLLSAGHYAAFTKDLHVMGQCRLSNAQFLQKRAGTFFSIPQLAKNGYTVFVAKSLEDFCDFLIFDLQGILHTSIVINVWRM